VGSKQGRALVSPDRWCERARWWSETNRIIGRRFLEFVADDVCVGALVVGGTDVSTFHWVVQTKGVWSCLTQDTNPQVFDRIESSVTIQNLMCFSQCCGGEDNKVMRL
jgi:hypothetical protein